jgi:hypothetical protein
MAMLLQLHVTPPVHHMLSVMQKSLRLSSSALRWATCSFSNNLQHIHNNSSSSSLTALSTRPASQAAVVQEAAVRL